MCIYFGMDTILYFYRKRGLERPETEPVGLKAYLLIRIGLDVEKNRWFGRELEEMASEEAGDAEGAWGREEESAAGGRRGAGEDFRGPEPARDEALDDRPQECLRGLRKALRHPLKAMGFQRMERKRKRAKLSERLTRESEEARLPAAGQQILDQVEAMMECLAREVAEFAEDMDSCLCVYEDSVRKALIGERKAAEVGIWGDGWGGNGGGREDASGYAHGARQGESRRQTKAQTSLPALWQRYFPMGEFHGYTEKYWMEQLFQRAACFHFILLGTAEGIFSVIEAYAGRMKSLRWVVTEAEYDRELEAFVEDFYTEYGLAIELQLLKDWSDLKRLRLFCKEAVNMVDFTGEACRAVLTVPEGSIWLDMFSVEEKKRRILARGKNIAYISMKELWKIAQKRCNCPVLP